MGATRNEETALAAPTPVDGLLEDESSSALIDWALRPWVLGVLGAIAGFAVHFLYEGSGNNVPWRAAFAAFVFFGSAAFAFTLDPKRWLEPLIFSLIGGLVMAGLAYNAVANSDAWAGTGFAFAAGVLATLLALPLFQAGFHRKRFATPYKDTHFHLWTDAVSGASALAFVGLSWILLFLLDGLLTIVSVNIIGDFIHEEWCAMMWSGGAFGVALGVLRNNLKIIASMQWLVLLVLSLLAIPLAAALFVFLAVLVFTGGQALWETSKDGTAILLACAAGCFIFTNAIIRDDDAARSKNRVMLGAAVVLAFGIFPLSVFAAISTGVRINQYGLSPERIWAMVSVGVALAYGIYYWAALIRGKAAGWADKIRNANFVLAVGVCVLALFLALPILNFGGISARDQVGRLQDGEVAAEDFDFAALKWDFGDAGRKVLAQLASGDGDVAKLAAEMQENDLRPFRGARRETTGDRDDRLANLVIELENPEQRKAIESWVEASLWRCTELCRMLDGGLDEDGKQMVVFVESRNAQSYRLMGNGDLDEIYITYSNGVMIPDSVVEIRPSTRRQVYVDGQPWGAPFD